MGNTKLREDNEIKNKEANDEEDNESIDLSDVK